jgi:hypothetical protein
MTIKAMEVALIEEGRFDFEGMELSKAAGHITESHFYMVEPNHDLPPRGAWLWESGGSVNIDIRVKAR